MNTAPIFDHIDGLRCSSDTEYGQGVHSAIENVLIALKTHLGKDDGYDPQAEHDTMVIEAFKAYHDTDTWNPKEHAKWSAVVNAVLRHQRVGRPWNELQDARARKHPSKLGPDAWWQIQMLSAASRTANPEVIKFAAQLCNASPCEVCGYVHTHCRCSPTTPNEAHHDPSFPSPSAVHS